MELSRKNYNETTNGSSSQLISSSIELVKKQRIAPDNQSSTFISRSKPKLLKHTLPKIIESRDEGRNHHNFRTVNGHQAHQEILLKLSPLANGRDAPMFSDNPSMKHLSSTTKNITLLSEGALSPVKKGMRKNSPDHPFMNIEEEQCTQKK